VKKQHLIAAAALAVLAAGCTPKKPLEKPEPTPTPMAAAPTPVPSKDSRYVVKKGDSLWKISAKSKVLGDPFRWPLIFKANRDQITDPDFIEPAQDLSYKKSYSKDDIADAVKKAQQTPPYEPHEQPRKVLPIQY
jgi:nucleoid-associated protein YgaU